MLATHLRQAATIVLEGAIRIAPPDTREWGEAMRGELNYAEGPWAGLMWSIGGATVLAKSALAAFLIPGRRGRGLVPDGGLFAKNISLRKAALIAGGACVLGALLFLLAPPFRQGMGVSLQAWDQVYRVPGWHGQPELAALAKRAEAQHDPEGLAFCAVRLVNSRESARLAGEAVGLDANLWWVYAIVAARNPELPEISEWLPRLQSRDPQNALFHLISAEWVSISHARITQSFPSQERQAKADADPAWQSAMAAAFASPKFDDYLGRLKELDRRVAVRYRFSDPYELLSGEETTLPTYAFADSYRFAESLLQSGKKLEAQGNRKRATEKYWAVARFGQVLDSQGHTDYEHRMGSSLQAGAYRHLENLSEKQGNADEAALFAYLGGKFEELACPGGT